MALTDFARKGYGQVEMNQVSSQKTGQIYASLKLDPQVTTLQNGEFMFYDAADEVVTGDTTTYANAAKMNELYLVYNEIKLYEGNRQNLRHFAMIKDGETGNYITSDSELGQYTPKEHNIDGTSPARSGFDISIESPYRMDGYAPRLYKLNVGDIFTTNMVKTGSGISYTVGDKLTPKYNSTTFTWQLEEDSSATINVFLVVKETSMPDGQAAVKLQKIA